MIPVIQPFHILVLALTGWLNRQQQAVIDLDVEYRVVVELTSEDTEHPIESALTMNAGSCSPQKFMRPSAAGDIHGVIHPG